MYHQLVQVVQARLFGSFVVIDVFGKVVVFEESSGVEKRKFDEIPECIRELGRRRRTETADGANTWRICGGPRDLECDGDGAEDGRDTLLRKSRSDCGVLVFRLAETGEM